MVMHLSLASGKVLNHQYSVTDCKWASTIDCWLVSYEPDSQINGYLYSKIRQR